MSPESGCRGSTARGIAHQASSTVCRYAVGGSNERPACSPHPLARADLRRRPTRRLTMRSGQSGYRIDPEPWRRPLGSTPSAGRYGSVRQRFRRWPDRSLWAKAPPPEGLAQAGRRSDLGLGTESLTVLVAFPLLCCLCSRYPSARIRTKLRRFCHSSAIQWRFVI